MAFLFSNIGINDSILLFGLGTFTLSERLSYQNCSGRMPVTEGMAAACRRLKRVASHARMSLQKGFCSTWAAM